MTEIGIAALPLDYPDSGSATYTRNLLRELPDTAPEWRFRAFTRWADPASLSVPTSVVTSPLARLNHGQGVGARLDKLTWEVASLPMEAALRQLAVLHVPYFAAPPVSSVPVVVTVHDLIPLILPGYFRSRQAAAYSRFMAWSVAHSARAIVTVSNRSRDDIVRILRVPESRVHVIYEGVETGFFAQHSADELNRVREKYGLPACFVLYLGGAERRKNIEVLLRAWSALSSLPEEKDVQLVIVATFPPPDELYPDIPGLATALRLGDRVRFIPRIDEVDKAAFYACATAFCFPSTYEGFGLPPLEAMASGVPTLCSNASSLPEVVGDGAVLLPPSDVGAWSRAIERVLRSREERAELRQRGLRRARGFTWSAMAQRTVEVYRSVVRQ